MRAPRRGNGADFDGRAPYRMYRRGLAVPGFCSVVSVKGWDRSDRLTEPSPLQHP